MDKQLEETLGRLRKKFGIGDQEPAREKTPAAGRSVWTRDTVDDTAAALEARHGIDPQRYRANPLYRRRVDIQAPGYARAQRRDDHEHA